MKKRKEKKQHKHLIGLSFSFTVHYFKGFFSLLLFFCFSFVFVKDESECLESLHTSSLVSECQNICSGFVLEPWQTGEGKVWSCRGTASLHSPSCTVILYEVEIKAREKLRARRNKEHGKKKRWSLEEEKCGKKRRLDQKDKGEEGRKAPCVSKTEAKYKEKEIKLLQEIVTPPVWLVYQLSVMV